MSVRIAWPKVGMDIELDENKVLVITIENKQRYVDFLTDLSTQALGGSGSIILSSNYKEMSIAKSVEVIFNPFMLEVNNKKVITSLYQELKHVSDTTMQEQFSKINAQIVDYLDILIQKCPYNLDFNVELDILGILKIFNVKVADNCGCLLENIIQYIRVMSRICRTNVFIFINLKDYLTEEELEMFYEFIKYEKVALILIESKNVRNHICEKHWIYDKDQCIIEIDGLTV